MVFIEIRFVLFACQANLQSKIFFQRFESPHSLTLLNIVSNGTTGKMESQLITFVVLKFVVLIFFFHLPTSPIHWQKFCVVFIRKLNKCFRLKADDMFLLNG